MPTSGSSLGSSSAVHGFADYLSELATDGNALVWELTQSDAPGSGQVAANARGARIPGTRVAELAGDALAALSSAPAPLAHAFAGTDPDRLEIKVLADDARAALSDVVSSFAASDAYARETSGILVSTVGHVDEGPTRAAFAALTRLAGALVVAELAPA
jgi:hypothetical protein